MICPRCLKREATVYFSRNINGKKENGTFLKKVFAIFDCILYNDRDTSVFLSFFCEEMLL